MLIYINFFIYRGCIICPTLHFDRSNLDFGAVALGILFIINAVELKIAISYTYLQDLMKDKK